jgi:hypothetical protein
MKRSCEKCRQSFEVRADEITFLEKMTFDVGREKVTLPPPVFCPDCRCQIRACHRNENYLYKVRSGLSGKDIVSIHHAVAPWGEPYVIYTQEEWRSDAWDPLSYGRPFDFARPFFEQFAELHKKVPRMALISLNNENSGFTTGTGFCKNCYLINSSENCEDCYYGKLFQGCQNCVDCSYIFDSQLCYECFSVHRCYGCHYVSFSQNCTDCFFSSDLKSCKNCCLCTNLVNKEYHFLNEPLSKEEYEKRCKEFQGKHSMVEAIKEKYEEAMRVMIRKYANITNSENCSGDFIDSSRNCLDCYDVNDSEDCRYVQVGVNVKDNYDCSNMYLKPELCYGTLGTIEVYHSAYCLFVFQSKNLLYCEYCFSCEDCFGCVGLTRRKYCIFNVQYTKEEYEEAVPRIVRHMEQTGEWGKFYPPQYSPFCYNESLASEYFPLTKEEALQQGFAWRDEDVRDFMPATFSAPENIIDVPDDITQEILSCAETKKNYRIIPQELAFYREQKIPLPRLCPDVRYRKRLALRNPRALWSRPCMQCGTSMRSPYQPDRPETVYCEKCYLEAVY